MNKYYVARVVNDRTTQLSKPMTGGNAHAIANQLTLANTYRNTRYMAISADCKPNSVDIKTVSQLTSTGFIDSML